MVAPDACSCARKADKSATLLVAKGSPYKICDGETSVTASAFNHKGIKVRLTSETVPSATRPALNISQASMTVDTTKA